VGRACLVISALPKLAGCVLVVRDIINATWIVVAGRDVAPRKMHVRHLQMLPLVLDGVSRQTKFAELGAIFDAHADKINAIASVQKSAKKAKSAAYSDFQRNVSKRLAHEKAKLVSAEVQKIKA